MPLPLPLPLLLPLRLVCTLPPELLLGLEVLLEAISVSELTVDSVEGFEDDTGSASEDAVVSEEAVVSEKYTESALASDTVLNIGAIEVVTTGFVDTPTVTVGLNTASISLILVIMGTTFVGA